MTTKIIQAEDREALVEAAEGLAKGQLVAFPTETVYGLGANALDPQAVKKIFEAKGRPSDNPLIVHVAEFSQLSGLVRDIPPRAQILMENFWPGPLTLVFRKSSQVPDSITAGLDTVAIRMPNNPTALALIKKSGVSVAAPSANLSGRPSPTTARHVLDDMHGKIPLILDGGGCEYGLESTVLKIGSPCVILRPGAVTKGMLEAVIGPVKLHKSLLQPLHQDEDAPSPGMKYKHYAPEAEVVVVTGKQEQIARCIAELYESYTFSGKSCVILATEQTQHFYHGKEYVIIGDRERPKSLCESLFSVLREQGGKADVLLCEEVPAEEAGLAFMNRLLRAAGFHTIQAE